MQKSRVIAVVCFITMVFSILNINVSVVDAATAKNQLEKLNLKKAKKKETITLKFSSFKKKNAGFTFNKKTRKATLKIKKTNIKVFRQRMKTSAQKLKNAQLEYCTNLKYKVIKKKKQKFGTAKVYIFATENVVLSAKKKVFGVVITAVKTVEEDDSINPSATPVGVSSMEPSATPGDFVYGETWTPNLDVYPTFKPSEVVGQKLTVKSEDYYHKIIVPDSDDASATYTYSTSDNLYTTKVKLKKMTSTFADEVDVDDNIDLVSVSCEKTATNEITLTLVANKQLACYSVKTDEGLQIWTCPYVPENLYYNSSANQAKVFLEGMTINSIVSSGDYDVTYTQSEDRTQLTISCPSDMAPVSGYDMAYYNGKINRIMVQPKKDITSICFTFSQPMYVRVKNNVKKNKCTLFLYNDTKMKNNYAVILDAGHGGKDNGATATYKNSDGEYVTVDEKTINLDIILKINDILTSKGMATILTRDSDKYVSLQDRVKIANKSKGKMFVSVHQNSFDTEAAKGTETYYYGGYTPNESGGFDSKTLAERIQEQLIITLNRDTNELDRGVKTANFYVIKNTNMPAILAEIAFISNTNDRNLLVDEDFQQLTATAIVNAIEMEFFQ